MERIAEALGMDPVRLREINAFKPGDETATGQKLGRDTSALAVLREAVRRSDFHRKRRAWAGTDRGIGLALFFHGSGFTGGGEVKLASKASLELTETGARILVASTEIGQGTRTMHAQIVADTLGIPYDRVEVGEADTARGPRQRADRRLAHLHDRRPDPSGVRAGDETAPRPADAARLPAQPRTAPHHEAIREAAEIQWSDETYRGDAYGAYGWGCDVAEIEKDPDTGEIRPRRITAVQEFGKAIHPTLAKGQIEGGTAQGVGCALLEDVVMRDGAMANAQLTNYMVPTTLDTPEIETVILENPYAHGPFGAKGVGEMPIDGPGARPSSTRSATGARRTGDPGDAGADPGGAKIEDDEDCDT